MEKDDFGKINLKIEKLKAKTKPSFAKPMLSDPDVLIYLEALIENMPSF